MPILNMRSLKSITKISVFALIGLMIVGCSEPQSHKIQDNAQVITVGSDIYPPFNYLDEDGKPTGIDIELAQESLHRLGYKVRIVQINWEQKTELVESGKIDIIWGCFSMEGRLDDYRWAGPYMVSNQVVAVNQNSNIYRLADLEGKNLAVQATTKPEGIFLKRTDKRIPLLQNLISMEDRALLFTFLSKGYADGVGAHETSILQYMKDYEAKFRILKEPLMTVGIGAAFAKNDERGICEKLDKVLEEMRLDGTSAKIISKYLGDPTKYLEVTKLAY